MRMNKLLAPLAFFTFMSNYGLAAEEDPWDKAYKCGRDWQLAEASGLGSLELLRATWEWPFIYFMKDGGFIYTHFEASPGYIWETYKSNTYWHLMDVPGAVTRLKYNDLGEFHEFLVETDYEHSEDNGDHWLRRFLLDKELMTGTRTLTKTTQGQVIYESKIGYGCIDTYSQKD
jgi:hypothetical protein